MDPRTCLKMILAVIGAVCLVYSVICWVLHWIFSRRKDLVGGVSGFLKQKKYKKDQVLFSPGWRGSPMFLHIKHQTTGTYEYVVNNKTYRKRHVAYVPKGEMPKLLSIRYLKKFPWIACEKDSNYYFELHALFSLFLAVSFFLIAFC